MITSCMKDEASTDQEIVNFDAAYVVNGESNTISIIDINTNTVENTIDLSKLRSSSGESQMGMGMDDMWPHNIYISHYKSKLLVAAPGMDFGGCGRAHILPEYQSGSRNLLDWRLHVERFRPLQTGCKDHGSCRNRNCTSSSRSSMLFSDHTGTRRLATCDER